MTSFNIQIISDTVCPWCYVGFRRLSRAIATHSAKHPTDTFNIKWSAFYLNANSPGYPGINKREMYETKFGAERSAAMIKRLTAIGEGEGIAFSYGGNTGSTRDSHRLLWYAGQQEAKNAGSDKSDGVVGGVQSRVAESLFKAYFEEEKNVTDRAVLTEAAVQAGFDRTEIEKFLESEAGGAEVDAEAQTAARRLVGGVPYYTIQGKYSVEGADEPRAFLEIFDQVKWAENV